MVELSKVRSSNKQIAATLPSGLIAVFVGATSGIGELAMRAFVQHSVQPRVYMIGRSKEASDRIVTDLKTINPQGRYTFIQADVSLITAVDKVCEQIRANETAINLLFQSQGSLNTGSKTSEQLHYSVALAHYSRARFIANLLPLLQQASSLRRVVSVFAGTKEGTIHSDDMQAWKIPLTAVRGHMVSLITLTMAHFAEQAPTVSFVHDYPGFVKSNIGRGATGIMKAASVMGKILGPLVNAPPEEVGERHLFYATSAKYPAQSSGDSVSVPVPGGVTIAKGIDGKMGSGVYTVDNQGEEGGPAVIQTLNELRRGGAVEEVRKDVVLEFVRITGVEAT